MATISSTTDPSSRPIRSRRVSITAGMKPVATSSCTLQRWLSTAERVLVSDVTTTVSFETRDDVQHLPAETPRVVDGMTVRLGDEPAIAIAAPEVVDRVHRP